MMDNSRTNKSNNRNPHLNKISHFHLRCLVFSSFFRWNSFQWKVFSWFQFLNFSFMEDILMRGYVTNGEMEADWGRCTKVWRAMQTYMESERTTRTQKKEIDFIIIEKKSIILLPNSPQESNASTILLQRKTVAVQLDCHSLIIKKTMKVN